jgi:sulfur carrier protein
MQLIINGKTEEYNEDLGLLVLLAKKDIARPETVAVELNGNIINKDQISTVRLRNEDRIEIIYFMGGGDG